MNKTPYDELVGFLKQADNYTQDTRQWPDPTEPRASTPPEPQGCTCQDGDKLNCPIHGLNGQNPWDVTMDHQWSLPENNPIGYPNDNPRTWTQAVSKLNPVVVSHSERKIVPVVSQVVDVKDHLVALSPLKHSGGPLHQPVEDDGHRGDGAGKDFESFSGHEERLAPEVPDVNQHTDQIRDDYQQTDQDSDAPHRPPERGGDIEQTLSHATPAQAVPTVERVHKWSVTQMSNIPSRPLPAPTPVTEPRPRRLVIHRDTDGRMASIEEVYT